MTSLVLSTLQRRGESASESKAPEKPRTAYRVAARGCTGSLVAREAELHVGDENGI